MQGADHAGLHHALEGAQELLPLGAVEPGQVFAVADLQARVDGGADVHLGHAVDEVLVHQHAVLDAVTAGLEGLFVFAGFKGLLIALHHELDGAVAHGVGGALALGVVHLLDVVPGLFPLPAALGGGVGIVGVGLAGVAGGAAGAAVDHELAGAHPEVLVAETGDEAQLHPVLVVLQGVVLAEDGVQGHVGADLEVAVPAHLLHDVVGGSVALAHVAHAGDAQLQALLLGLHGRLALLGLGVLHLAPEPEVGVAPDLAGELAVRHHDLALGILLGILGAVDLQVFQSLGVIDGVVAVAGDGLQGVVGGHGVQLLQGGIALLLEKGGLKAHAGDPLAGGLGVGDGLQDGQHRGDILGAGKAGIHHGGVQIGADHAVEDGMVVGVVDAGHQGAALEVDHLGLLVDELVDLLIGAHEDDFVALHAHGLGDLVLGVDGDDAAVLKGDVQIGEIKIHWVPSFLR